MKKIYQNGLLVVLLFIAFSTTATAQADSAQTSQLETKLVTTICTCISQKDPSTIKTVQDVYGLLITCATSDGLSAFSDYATATRLDVNNMDQLRGVCIKLFTDLSLNCPAMTKIATNIIQDTTQMNQLLH